MGWNCITQDPYRDNNKFYLTHLIESSIIIKKYPVIFASCWTNTLTFSCPMCMNYDPNWYTHSLLFVTSVLITTLRFHLEHLFFIFNAKAWLLPIYCSLIITCLTLESYLSKIMFRVVMRITGILFGVIFGLFLKTTLNEHVGKLFIIFFKIGNDLFTNSVHVYSFSLICLLFVFKKNMNMNGW